MRKFRQYLSLVFTVPAAVFALLHLWLLAVGAAVAGEGFCRTLNIVLDEYQDALKVAQARIRAGSKR